MITSCKCTVPLLRACKSFCHLSLSSLCNTASTSLRLALLTCPAAYSSLSSLSVSKQRKENSYHSLPLVLGTGLLQGQI